MSAKRPAHDVPPLSDPGFLEDLDKGASKVYMLLGELRALTKWNERVLLGHLGCDPDAPRPDDADADQLLLHSVAYLTWVRELCYLVDRPVDRHDILHGAYELCAAAGGSLGDRVQRCAAACNANLDDGLSARDLIQLGEISQAWLQAAAALGGPARERAERVMALAAPEGALMCSHLHPRRLQLLLAGSATAEQEIGLSVARRMQEHLNRCERCDSVAHELDLVTPPSAHAAG